MMTLDYDYIYHSIMIATLNAVWCFSRFGPFHHRKHVTQSALYCIAYIHSLYDMVRVFGRIRSCFPHTFPRAYELYAFNIVPFDVVCHVTK